MRLSSATSPPGPSARCAATRCLAALPARWLPGLLAAWLSLVLPLVAAAQEGVLCPKESIEGFEDEHRMGNAVLPGNVIGKKNMWVYVTRKNGFTYIQSNNRPTAAFEFPIKAAFQTRNLRLLHENLYTFNGKVTPDFDIRAAYENDATFVFDEAVLTDDGTIDLDIGPKISDNVYVLVDGTPPPKRLRQIQSMEVPPKWMAEYGPSIFAKIRAGFRPSVVLDKMQRLPFRKSDMQIVSFYRNSKVEAKLAQSPLASLTAELADISKAELEKVFATSRAQIITILGHSDGSAFVTASATDSRQEIRIEFSTVQALAAKYRKDVIYLGCNSYLGAEMGADRPFSMPLAIDHLERAVQAQNLRDFLGALSSARLGMVLDETAFAHSTSSATEAFPEAGPAAGTGQPPVAAPTVFSFALVRKIPTDRVRNDHYQVGQQEGIVRFISGYYQPTAAAPPDTTRVDPAAAPPAGPARALGPGPAPVPGPGISGKTWGILGAVWLLGGTLLFLTCRKKPTP